MPGKSLALAHQMTAVKPTIKRSKHKYPSPMTLTFEPDLDDVIVNQHAII